MIFKEQWGKLKKEIIPNTTNIRISPTCDEFKVNFEKPERYVC